MLPSDIRQCTQKVNRRGRLVDAPERAALSTRRWPNTFILQWKSVVADLAAHAAAHADDARRRHLRRFAARIGFVHACRRRLDAKLLLSASAASSRIPLVGTGVPSRMEGRARVPREHDAFWGWLQDQDVPSLLSLMAVCVARASNAGPADLDHAGGQPVHRRPSGQGGRAGHADVLDRNQGQLSWPNAEGADCGGGA